MKLGNSVTRMTVEGDHARIDRSAMVDQIQKHAILPLTHEDDVDQTSGWAGFHHQLDLEFNRDKVFANEYALLAYRTDAFRIPAGTLKLEQERAEFQWLAENHKETMPRHMRKALDAETRRLLRAKTPPSIGAIPVVWNTATGQVWIWTQSAKVRDDICDLFFETFGFDLHGTGPGELAERSGETDVPSDSELGADFLAWLWWRSERGEAPEDRITLTARLQLDGMPGPSETSYRADDPTEIGEARLGLRSGRRITSAGLRFEPESQAYRFTLRAVDLGLSGVKLPVLLTKGEEENFYETMFLFEKLAETIETLFIAFLADRLGQGWGKVQGAIQHWARMASRQTITALSIAEKKALTDRALDAIDGMHPTTPANDSQDDTNNVVPMRRPRHGEAV